MAWVKIKTIDGQIFTVPETLYNTLYKENEAYSLVEEPKPITPKQETKKEEIVKDDEQIQKHKLDEINTFRKGSKKIG